MNSHSFMRDGVLPSTITLPQNPPATLLDFFTLQFSQYPRSAWRSRFERGLVIASDGHPQSAHRLCVPNETLLYFREIDDEVSLPFTERVVYEDAHIIVADKPHFMATLPVGQYLRETLLCRLRHRLQNPNLVALHRLDRETAGLVMFSKQADSRDSFHQLFRQHRIEKTYMAVAGVNSALEFPRVHCSHIGADAAYFFRRCEWPNAQPNAKTFMDLLATADGRGLYLLRPVTGKTHQLRVHMSAIGLPIEHDRLYPSYADVADDFSRPLQLLAQTLSFRHPISHESLQITSSFSLNWK